MALLYAPADYWSATPEALAAVCNGCGAGITRWLVPDTLWGLNVRRACCIHDWMYAVGAADEAGREEADRVLLNNCLRLIETARVGWWGRLLAPLRRYRAVTYYNAVRAYGGPAYWANKNAPERMRHT